MKTLLEALGQLFQIHPWHGIPTWAAPRTLLNAFVEVVPRDGVKYEMDRRSGHLRVDRPQSFSVQCPSLYGFVPRTIAGTEVAEIGAKACGLPGLIGDGDPLDVCVLTEKTILRGGFLVRARPVGGIRTVDAAAADDKVVAVLDADPAYGGVRDLDDVPPAVLRRLHHYFKTYKQPPDVSAQRVRVVGTFGREEAVDLIDRAVRDYRNAFPELWSLGG